MFLLADQTGQITPEIVISDNKFGTSDTSSSNESGYASAADERDEHVYDVGSLSELTQLRLLDKCAVSPYR